MVSEIYATLEDKISLTPQEEKFFNLFSVEKDTPIKDLYRHTWSQKPLPTPRMQQQIVGVLIANIDKKFEFFNLPYRIKPGNARRSYTLKFVSPIV